MQFKPTRPATFSHFDIQRRVVANKTLEGWREAPHASVIVDLEMDAVLEMVRALKSDPDFAGVRVTLNSVMLKIIAEGLRAAPEMNSHVAYNGTTAVGGVTRFEEVNIAVPFRSADGRMITPVVRDIAHLPLRGVCAAMDDLKEKAANTPVDVLLREAGVGDSVRRLLRGDLRVLWRLWCNLAGPARLPKPSQEDRRRWRETPPEKRVTPENLVSATALVSNMGSVVRGMDAAFCLLDLIQPATVAVGLGAVSRKPVARMADGGESVVIRSILPMTLVFDHRVMDLEQVIPFLETVQNRCLNPRLLLRDDVPPETDAAFAPAHPRGGSMTPAASSAS
ncbi:MAG: 2-oxo acid dehydrogenase subunit E2 [Candidatus Hydrogenedens sp.]|nr:2-oxo acid dehydrogenase subunit E2 [Candidatus Hydrogenedentota bacterium]NLF57061.1 2-oxo acid dehydrogenase subunit E2 [Candidatus Hydrogenedens sp.]